MNLKEKKIEIIEDINKMNTESRLWLNTKELSKYLKVSIPLLESWRTKAFGPAYSNLGKRKIIYLKKDIAEFIIHNKVKTL